MRKVVSAWRRIDIILTAVLMWSAIQLCIYFAARNRYSSERLLYTGIGICFFIAVFIAEIVMRLRNKQLNMIWREFFKLYIRRPTGILIALLLAANTLYVCVYYPFKVFKLSFTSGSLFRGAYAVYLDFNITVFLFSVFTLAVLTNICSHLLSLAKEYEKANAEKIRAERFKAELITNVSHDIRTPLTSVINYVDLLKALPVEHEAFSEYVNVLDKKSTRLKTLINDLMEASKAATGNMAVNLREIELSEIVGQIAGEFDEQFTERDLTLVLRQPDQPVFVQADSGHLWRVFENLFGNAAKYALPKTRVFAEIVLRGDRAVFSIKNTSQNPIELSGDALTEQFIRGDRARQTEGSGLGLHIAKSLVELMGGYFEIRASGDLFEAEIVFSKITK